MALARLHIPGEQGQLISAIGTIVLQVVVLLLLKDEADDQF
jgi:hypothetical protein